MVSVRQEVGSLFQEVLLQVWDLAAYPHGTERRLSPNVRIGCGDECLDFGEKISGHFDGRDVAERAEGEADYVLVGMPQITAGDVSKEIQLPSAPETDVLLQRVRHQGEYLLIFVEEQARGKVTQPLIGEAGGCQELQALDLAKMRALAEGEEV